jgi:hypothetical protein
MKTHGLIVFVCLAMAVYQPVSAGETAHYTLAEAELSRAKSDRETAQNGVVRSNQGVYCPVRPVSDHVPVVLYPGNVAGPRT